MAVRQGSRNGDRAVRPTRAGATEACLLLAPVGRCRRVEGFIAQGLQRRHNHESFELVRVSVDRRPDLAEKFRIEQVPTICVAPDGSCAKPSSHRAELARLSGSWSPGCTRD